MEKLKTILINLPFWVKISEMAILYLVFPLLLVFDVIPFPLMVVLVIMGTSVIIFLQYDNTFDKKQYINWASGKKHFLSMFLFFVLSAAVMVLTIWLVDSAQLFILLKENPQMMLMIAIFYPFFSVIPQGLAYRVLFFHRYANLFSSKWTQIFVSALFFSFGHVIYKSPLVMFLTFIAGLIFAYRYHQSKSYLLSAIEHALYGVWMFTSGLGIYFISSAVN